jgi:DNA-binding LacI/PurR family transcriptional regulator
MNQGASKKRRLAEARIRTLAQGLLDGAQLPTVRELCTTHQLSYATMELVLKQLELEKVLVRRPGSGIYAGAGTSQKTIGLVIGKNIFTQAWSPYWSQLLQAAFRVAGERELRCFSYMPVQDISLEWAKHAQLERDIASGDLDGILIVVEPEKVTREWLQGGSLPVVQLNGPRNAWSVCHDTASVIEQAVGVLAEAGSKRVALLAKNLESFSKPFAQALKRRGLLLDSRLTWGWSEWYDRIPNSSQEEFAAQIVISRWETLALVNAQPDGIVIMDDTMARGAMRAFEAHGITVGRDIRIAALGTKHSPVLADHANKLFLLQIDPEEQARMGFEMLELLMAGKKPKPSVQLIRPRMQMKV